MLFSKAGERGGYPAGPEVLKKAGQKILQQKKGGGGNRKQLMSRTHPAAERAGKQTEAGEPLIRGWGGKSSVQ